VKMSDWPSWGAWMSASVGEDVGLAVMGACVGVGVSWVLGASLGEDVGLAVMGVRVGVSWVLGASVDEEVGLAVVVCHTVPGTEVVACQHMSYECHMTYGMPDDGAWRTSPRPIGRPQQTIRHAHITTLKKLALNRKEGN
jgi:hypothetical protein